MDFASDNWAGAAPEVVDAIAREAGRFGAAYGDSEIDRRVGAKFNEIFERDVAVFFVGTGTAANGLALASVNRPGGVVFCHRESHIAEHECGGVEHLTGGARPDRRRRRRWARSTRKRFAPPSPGSLRAPCIWASRWPSPSRSRARRAESMPSIEIAAIAGIARERGLPLHMDGARFANALVQLGVTPAEMTWKAGVDILSFGATKNGCIAAEALVFFDPAHGEARCPISASAPGSSSRSRASSRRSSTPIFATACG